jgi:transposase InsO family protein
VNTHKNARLTFEGRKLLVERIAVMGLMPAAEVAGTAWLPAFLNYYNARRPHSALAYKPPASRLGGNNLLQLNS